jgi:Xaa-Pro aminopeptidase
MNSSAFRSHRARTVEIFRSAGLTHGLIVYQSPSQPKEPFTDSALPFTQEGLFFWLTGWEDPDSCIIIDIATGGTIFLLPCYDAMFEIMHGLVPTPEEVIAKTGVDRVDSMINLQTIVDAVSPSIIYATPLPLSLNWPEIDRATLLSATGIARTIKTPQEIACLRAAAVITGQVICDLWRWFRWREGMTELEIEAFFEYRGRLLGCKSVAFSTTVGSGINSCFLHYDRNCAPIREGDLILLDCGLFYHHYAGDITRCFPASGKFSHEQAVVYGALLRKQKMMIQLVRPGVTWVELNEAMRMMIFDVLKEVGVVAPDSQYSRMLVAFFLPHGLSHHIGCNVHDYCFHHDRRSRIADTPQREWTLTPGHVISIEPGIYFHPTRLAMLDVSVEPYDQINMDVALELSKTVGGIRIEDDVLVTDTGYDVLSADCPKEIEQIEALLGSDLYERGW